MRAWLVLVLVLVLLGATAHAQAPGAMPSNRVPATVLATRPGSMPAAPAPAPAQAPPVSVMTRRWAIALAFEPETLTPKVDGAPHVSFATLELAGRVRLRPDIELGLALQAGGAAQGDFSTSGLFADFRYRFLADKPWNVFALAGLGVGAAAQKDATDVQKKGRGALRLGGGVERRFTAWAIEGRLTFVGIGENTEVPAVTRVTTAYQLERYGLSGAALSVGGVFYF